jgi:hypothetical protein
VKFVELIPVPPALVALIGPVVAAAGTFVVMVVSEITVNGAAAPLKATIVTLEKFVPVSVTPIPTGPLVGVKLVMVGGKIVVPFTGMSKRAPLLRPKNEIVVLSGPDVEGEKKTLRKQGLLGGSCENVHVGPPLEIIWKSPAKGPLAAQVSKNGLPVPENVKSVCPWPSIGA